MHIPTHIFSGWCVANAPPLTSLSARERFFCVVAAVAPDIDGIAVIWSEMAYFRWHHVLAHNIFFGALLAGVLTWLSRPFRGGARWPLFLPYLGLFHLHLLLDAFGSGPDWPTYYLWPLSEAAWGNPHGWAFDSWQNYGTAFLLIALTIHIYRTRRRGPLEYIFPYADNLFVRLFNPGGKSADGDTPTC